MYTLLILFFGSLIGIIVMISRKLRVIESGDILESEFVNISQFDLQNLKNYTVLNLKRLGGVILISTLRGYVKTTIFIKNKYESLKDMRTNTANGESADEQKISKFLKIISEYKHKIRDIKEKIKEEENNSL